MSRLSRRSEQTAASPDTLVRIADAAGVNAMWLIFGRGPVGGDDKSGRALRFHPDWPKTLQEAQKRQRGIPDEFWELAGNVAIPRTTLDWQLIVGLVREIYSAHQRALEGEEHPPPEEREYKPAVVRVNPSHPHRK
jgi:hypothetical protein